MEQHHLGFWNLENLLDINTSNARPEYLQKILKGELQGWTASILNKKIKQLVSIIAQMNQNKGPDILGICEIENRPVVERLLQKLQTLNRNYKIAHTDSDDGRGLDVAIIYDSTRYEAERTFNYFVQKRSATRDIFQVNFKTSSGNTLVIVSNHWPSRTGGQFETEPYRIMVGETLAYFHKRILEELGEDTAIIAMGDFNDEPFDRSIMNYAKTTREKQKVLNAKSVDYFYNLMWEITGQRQASYYFGNQPNVFDQFWVSKGIVKKDSKFKVEADSVKLVQPPELIASGKYPRARKFSRPSEGSKFDPDGFSDHFPIEMVLLEKTN